MTGREVALQVLTACRKLDAWSDGSFKVAARDLDKREAAFAARLTYGVLQNRALLDYYLSSFCAQPFADLEPFVRDVLRLGAYQILFMDRVPGSAAVSEAVNMVKSHKRQRAAGFVNAVLRQLSRNKEQLPQLPSGGAAEVLSLRYSHPMWLVERLIDILGEQGAEAFLQADNTPTPVVVQRNPLKCDVLTLEKYWQAAGVQTRPHAWMPDCWEITSVGNLEELSAFREGWFQVQDAAARAAACAAGVAPGSLVLDVCAAPGGKSFAMAMEMRDQGRIIACDIYENKLRAIEKGAERLGIHSIETSLADGRENRAEWNGVFSTVLCDVPCSGLGIIRKKPDIRYKSPEPLARLPKIQLDILKNAARYVAPGGILLYATCTILPEENDGVVDAFLRENPTFHKEPFVLPGELPAENGSMTLWPQCHDTDGFYLCRMRRT